MKLANRTLKWLIILYIVVIMAFSVAMISRKIHLHKIWVLNIRLDYILHALLFMPWMVLLCWRKQKKKSAIFFFLAFAVGLLLAVVSEGSQYFLYYRSFDINDLLTNCVGVVIGGMIGWIINFRHKAVDNNDGLWVIGYGEDRNRKQRTERKRW